MLKNYFSILSLLFLAAAFGQQKEINSLKQTLNTQQNDTLRVNQLNELAFLYYTSKPDTTLVLAQEAIALAKKNGFGRGEARGLSLSGTAFYMTGNLSRALELFLNSLRKYEDLEDLEGISKSTNNIAVVYIETGNYNQALENFFKALEISQKSGNKNSVATSLSNIGVIYSKQQKLDSARSYTLDAYNLALEFENSLQIKILSLNLGGIYYKKGQPGMALEYYKIATRGEVDILTSETALGMAKIFRDERQRDSTLYYAKYAYDIAEKGGFTNTLLDISSFLAEYYENHNNIDSAYAYQKIGLAAKDSLFSQEKRKKVQALALEETARQQEIETALLEMEQKKRLNFQYLGITAGIVAFILLFLILSRSIIIGEKWLGFLGIFILLLVFEFTNLYFTPIISEATNYSPVWTLLIMVGIAALLVPLHHKIEKYITKKMVKKNKQIRLAAARKTIERLEREE